MTNIRRYDSYGKPYFIAVVTFERIPLLVTHADLLVAALTRFLSVGHEPCARDTEKMIAWVILPDHFHAIVDVGTNSISTRVQQVKMSFGALLRKRLGKHGGRIWQRRFWDHIIRDQEDLNRHIDYIHFNPVKHGHVLSPFDWALSSTGEPSFRDIYPSDWGSRTPQWNGDFGE